MSLEFQPHRYIVDDSERQARLDSIRDSIIRGNEALERAKAAVERLKI